jgi:formylglycine-generating enzyme required for sulfatase activity
MEKPSEPPDLDDPATLGPTVGSPWTVPDLSLEMLWCKPGSFQMGSPEDEEGRDDNETLHEVTLTSGYWLGKHTVTQAQWEKAMGDNPSHFKGANRPVVMVTWDDVTSFCEKLTELEREAGRLPAGMTYQLPTEAQWEYACRAGTTTAYAFGNSLTADQANVYVSTRNGPTDVGKYAANAWGFHDMHGNVDEWCADWFKYDYPTGNVTDPAGPADGFPGRVRRGNSWDFTADGARSARRLRYGPDYGDQLLGFRLSLQPPSKTTSYSFSAKLWAKAFPRNPVPPAKTILSFISKD